MNQQADSGFIVSELQSWPGLRDKVIATLAKNDLSDYQRRSWLLVFKRFSRMHRKILYAADWHEVMPPDELAELWREFVETGATFCDGQEKIISAKLESPRLTIGQRCVLYTMFTNVVKLSRDFEAYKDEMPAAGSPH